MPEFGKFDALPGHQIGVSGWKQIAQERIDRFAEATDDFQFVHVDAARAAAETPFGGTIAHGFLTLALISALAEEIFPATPGLKAVILGAIDRVKFISPVKAGQRVRGRFVLGRLAWLLQTKALVKVHATIEIEDQAEPALRCDVSWLLIYQYDNANQSEAWAGPPSQFDQA